MMRAAKSPGAWVLVSSIAMAVVVNSSSLVGIINPNSSRAEERPMPSVKSQSIREGSILPDQVGTFRVSGDRVQFVESESGRTFRCLENLMLQRVHQVITEEVTPPSWIVSGKATEYRGENYLFIEAVRRTK
jgi:hypothetical protein